MHEREQVMLDNMFLLNVVKRTFYFYPGFLREKWETVNHYSVLVVAPRDL